MNFSIGTRFPGRLRVRLGRTVFTKEQGIGLSNSIFSFKGVEKVLVSPSNGSILIVYDKLLQDQVEQDVFSFLDHLSLQQIRSQEEKSDLIPISLTGMEQEAQLKRDLLHLCLTRAITQYLMPVSWVPYYQWWRSFEYLKSGIRGLFRKKITVEVLDATAISVSLLRKDYKTASSTMFLLQLSDLLLEFSNARAKNQLAQSLYVKSKTVWILENGTEKEINSDSLKIGNVVRLRKGVMIPVDGKVISGNALVNEASMTGESLAVHKETGSVVFAGTLMEEGELDITVMNLSQDSRISKVVDLIQTGEETKANIQGKAEVLADGIVPYSLALFGLTYLFTRDIARAVSVLMVDFSCAIKLTTPIAVISALKEGAEHGIVVKGGKYLEQLAQVDTVVFDKTGTLTKAIPKVAKVISVHSSYTEDDVLRISACLEEHFPHSVASAIVAEGKNRGLLHPETHGNVEYIVAHGIVAWENDIRYAIGSYHFIFEDEGIFFPEEGKRTLKEDIGAYSAVYLAIGTELVGVICIFDPPRPEAKHVISNLRTQGIGECAMITGDSEATAALISKELALDSYKAGVLPDEKAKLLELLQSSGKKVLMVGDGINDAPALSTADVSLTMADSSDIAREVADISVISHDLQDIVKARQLATGLMSRIAHHYNMIVGFNGSLLLLGAFGVFSASQNALLHNCSTLIFAALSTKPLLQEERNKKEVKDETT